MQLGMVGLGRMGGAMVQRLIGGGHSCVVFDTAPGSVAAAVERGARGSKSLQELIAQLAAPRVVWVMVPAVAVDGVLDDLWPHLQPGDILVDGGNTHYVDDIRRAGTAKARGIHFVDAGVSGGIWGKERGYCLMIGGEPPIVRHLDPIFATLAPGGDANAPGTAQRGYLHCGPTGAGHFVKMVHNGIEYALMGAYAEGFNLLAHAPGYDFALDDIAEAWRHGSVIGSWLLDLTARALARDPALEGFAGRVADSGEGRWAAHAAIDSTTPAPLLAAALFQRYTSRGESAFADRLLSALRHEFGGHREPPAREDTPSRKVRAMGTPEGK